MSSQRDASLQAVDHHKALWHGRKATLDIIHEHADQAAQEAIAKGGGQGLWTGVVFPCMSNILGVILFLRAPWIVGRAGIANAVGLVFICCLCTFVTTLSLSAIATNGKIKGGGSYYLISRSMGPALGAGVGLCFYMANSIGAAMYFIGTTEAWEIAMPSYQILQAGDVNNIRVTSFCILVICLIIVGGGVKYVARLGTFFLFVVLAVIVCMYLGCFIGPDQPGTSDSVYDIEVSMQDGSKSGVQLTWGGMAEVAEYFSENWGPGWTEAQKAFPLDNTIYSFVSMMGLWFPANTGIMAGSNRSADLKDPTGTIPKGTLFAQLVTSFIYLSFIVLYGCVAPRQTLLDDKFFAATAAWPLKEVVIYGVMASTIGAGLTSLTSGSRLLSAIASDNTLPILRCFAAKPGKEPRAALLASGVLCACAIGIGELNAVAPILTMFFLMCYTCVNTSCTISEAVQDPNWRPSFRYYHWCVSFFGALLCIFMMFAMSPATASLAIVFCSVVMSYAAYNSHAVKWGDGFQGMKFQLARNILMKMDLKTHIKNWRPQLLVVTKASIVADSEAGSTEHLTVDDPELLKLVSQLKGGRGITIIGAVCSSKGEEHYKNECPLANQDNPSNLIDGRDAMKDLLKRNNIEGFGHVMYTENFADGLQSLIQVAGLGAFQPNCIVASWPDEQSWRDKGTHGVLTRSHFLHMVQTAVRFNKVALVAKGNMWPEFNETLSGTIDIWWIVGDGGVLLLLPFLMKKHKVWSNCRIRLFILAKQTSGQDPELIARELNTYVKDFRINVEIKVKMVNPDHVDVPTDAGKLDIPNDAEKPRVAVALPSSSANQGNSTTTCCLDSCLAYRHNVSTLVSEPSVQPKACDSLVKTISEHCPPKRDMSFDDRPTRKTSAPASMDKYLFHGGVSSDASELKRTVSQETSKSFVERLQSQLAGQGEARNKLFVDNAEQFGSVVPCSLQELKVAEALGDIMREESQGAELVVTNLPDVPHGESALGYFEMVNELTLHFKRCLLVRGTATEVITAFT